MTMLNQNFYLQGGSAPASLDSLSFPSSKRPRAQEGRATKAWNLAMLNCMLLLPLQPFPMNFLLTFQVPRLRRISRHSGDCKKTD